MEILNNIKALAARNKQIHKTEATRRAYCSGVIHASTEFIIWLKREGFLHPEKAKELYDAIPEIMKNSI